LSDPEVNVAVAGEDVEAATESDRLHEVVGWVLRAGLAASVLLMASGMTVRLATGGDDAPSVPLWRLKGDTGLVLTTLGVMVLALTPALRVLALVALWWRERDWRFVAVALAVVAILATGVLIGKGG
jgi:uncharacterized membrane protein